MPRLTDLAGTDWSVSCSKHSNIPCRVPGYALEALLAAQIISDPLFRFNELEYRWTALEDWTFSCQFDIATETLTCPCIDLVLGGVDTAATILLNGQEVMDVCNAHRHYRLPVRQHLIEGSNRLEIVIRSAPEQADANSKAYPYPVPSMQGPGMMAHYNFLRKPACDFGWDWGPAFAPAGISGPVSLEAYHTACLTGFNVRQQLPAERVLVDCSLLAGCAGATGVLNVQLDCGRLGSSSCRVQHAEAGDSVITVEVSLTGAYELWWPAGYGGQRLYQPSVTYAPDAPARAAATAAAALPCASVGTQTPPAAARQQAAPAAAGHGAASGPSGDGRAGTAVAAGGVADVAATTGSECPSVGGWETAEGYQMVGRGRSGGGRAEPRDAPADQGRLQGRPEEALEEPQTLRRRVGFRRVELVREAIPGVQPGAETFLFRINDVDVFVKGANVIPIDIIATRVTPERLRRLVQDAAAAHMNMLRVWGGGGYPHDAFYDACDELGLLVWQEAMFACSPYPRHAPFLDNVAEEVRQQARRLNHHAAVCVWGGNNEIEQCFDWNSETRDQAKLYAVDYAVLFLDTVRAALAQVDADMPFLDSSPSNGLISTNPYVKRWGDCQSTAQGDVHFYNYVDNVLDPAIYPRAKFVSEFGYQSYPSWLVYRRATAPEDWSAGSEMSEFRQRHPSGNQELRDQLARHFPLPPDAASDGSGRAFALWIYLTQVQQARCYDTAIRLWRRSKHDPAARTMGVLYWQLNDIWQGPSWSGIDYGGHWRLLHYAARRFYAPLLVSAEVDRTADTITVHVTSDVNAALGGRVTAQILRWDAGADPDRSGRGAGSDNRQHGVEASFSLEPLGSKVALTMPLEEMLERAGCSYAECFIRLEATASHDARGIYPDSLPGDSSAAPELDKPAAACLYRSRDHVYLTEFKDSALSSLHTGAAPQIVVTGGEQLSRNDVRLTLRCPAVAPFVALDTEISGVFGDNGFMLLPSEPTDIVFTAHEEVDAARLRESLHVTSLLDVLA